MNTTAPNPIPPSAFFDKFRAWMKNPREVASVCPSSRVLTSFIAHRPIIGDAEVIVDLGPANGETTRELLSQMKPRATLVAVEKNEQLAQSLDQIQDDRLIAIHDDASNLSCLLSRYHVGRPKVIVSGIPFSSLESDKAERIVQSIHDLLQPSGQFIAYQCRDTLAKYAKRYFSNPEVTRIWRNVPPLRVFVWTKQR
jgi:phosphatidylethanolamine/phosphatidyl-N-methylethanolamine N-methyltransferase